MSFFLKTLESFYKILVFYVFFFKSFLTRTSIPKIRDYLTKFSLKTHLPTTADFNEIKKQKPKILYLKIFSKDHPITLRGFLRSVLQEIPECNFWIKIFFFSGTSVKDFLRLFFTKNLPMILSLFKFFFF